MVIGRRGIHRYLDLMKPSSKYSNHIRHRQNARNRATGSSIMIDNATHNTAAGTFVYHFHRRVAGAHGYPL